MDCYEPWCNGIKTIFKGNAASLNHKDDKFDFIVISNAPIYLSEAARVLKPAGLLLVTYSFSGDTFLHLKADINQYLHNNGIELLEMKCTGNGVYILGQKLNKKAEVIKNLCIN